MAHIEKDNKMKDFTHNWVTTSKFLFHVKLFCLVAFIVGGSVILYQKRYKGAPQVEVNESSKYTPVYK